MHAASAAAAHRHLARGAAGPGARSSSPGGTLFGVPLLHVLQISPVLAAFCPFPVPGGVVAGLLAHAGALWPVYALPAFLGQPPAVESQVVLLELAGIQVALCASRVLGIEHGLAAGERGGAVADAGRTRGARTGCHAPPGSVELDRAAARPLR